MEILASVKLLLGITDSVRDDKLSEIIDITANRLKLYIKRDEVPSELLFIVKEVSVIRFNRIASEGMISNSVEGESLTFNDDDFSQYRKDIEAWKSAQGEGNIKFL